MESEETLEVIYKKFKNQYSYDVPKKLSTLIELYEDLIKECKEGYLFTIYELDDELSSRDFIEDFLKFLKCSNPQLSNDIQANIMDLDLQLKTLFTTAYSRPIIGSETRWWHKGILKFSGQNYAKNVKSEYGIKVEVIDV